jgi:hypothetical protein
MGSPSLLQEVLLKKPVSPPCLQQQRAEFFLQHATWPLSLQLAHWHILKMSKGTPLLMPKCKAFLTEFLWLAVFQV